MKTRFRGSAAFNDDHTHRYNLTRQWDAELENVLFIGLNPSRADGIENDRTISRCEKFAQLWGYGGMYFCNLYSFRTPYTHGPVKNLPGENWIPLFENLNEASNQFTDVFLKAAMERCSKVVCAWGGWGIKTLEREKQVLSLIEHPFCFGQNSDGSPKHPLYLLGTTKPVPFDKNQYLKNNL